MILNNKFTEVYWIVDKISGINIFNNKGFSTFDRALIQFNRELERNPVSGSFLVVVDRNNKIVYEDKK